MRKKEKISMYLNDAKLFCFVMSAVLMSIGILFGAPEGNQNTPILAAFWLIFASIYIGLREEELKKLMI